MIPESDRNDENFRLRRTGTFTKYDRRNQPMKMSQLPAEAYSEKYQRAWEKLTAIAKGFLTRQLLKTEKVQMLKLTIKETVSCALQLHLESPGPPSREDLQLHARLLAQIESACHDIYDIFFRLGVHERMSILALNRAAVREKMIRSQYSDLPSPEKKKRLSSATEARLRSKNSPKVETWNEKRQKAVKESRVLSLKTGHVLIPEKETRVSGTRRSPRVKTTVRKTKVISTSRWKISPTSLYSVSPYAKKDRPVWK